MHLYCLYSFLPSFGGRSSVTPRVVVLIRLFPSMVGARNLEAFTSQLQRFSPPTLPPLWGRRQRHARPGDLHHRSGGRSVMGPREGPTNGRGLGQGTGRCGKSSHDTCSSCSEDRRWIVVYPPGGTLRLTFRRGFSTCLFRKRVLPE